MDEMEGWTAHPPADTEENKWMDDHWALVWALDDSLEWTPARVMYSRVHNEAGEEIIIARRVIAWRDGDRFVPLRKGFPIAEDDPFYPEAIRQIKEAAPGDMSWVV